MPAITAILLDLDDTLYSELDFVDSGLSAVAAEIGRLTRCDAAPIHFALRYDLLKYGRTAIIDRAVAAYGLAPADKDALVAVYRDHRPQISLYPGVRELLGQLASRWPLAIVTDGAVEIQRRKVEALGVEALVPRIVYCWEAGKHKPDPGGFLVAAEAFGFAPDNCLVVGDDPTHDMEAARRGGFPACRVMSGRFATLASPPEFAHLPHLPNVLDLPQHLAISGSAT